MLSRKLRIGLGLGAFLVAVEPGAEAVDLPAAAQHVVQHRAVPLERLAVEELQVLGAVPMAMPPRKLM